jgi:DNA-directed RNA polymerase sigma subunit (sigma70/sigma32)
MTFPSNAQILKALSEIEKKKKANMDSIIRIPPVNAPIEERFKFNISQKILEFKISKDYSLDDMAKLLGTDRSNVSKILNGRIEKVSLDRLFSYLRIVVLASKNKKMLSDFNKKIEHFIEFEELKFA